MTEARQVYDPSNYLPPKGPEAVERLQGLEIDAGYMKELAQILLDKERLANGMEIYIGKRKDPAAELFSMDYNGPQRVAKIFVPAAGERQLLPVEGRKGFLPVLIENYLKLQRRAYSPDQATAESKPTRLTEDDRKYLEEATKAFMDIVMRTLDEGGGVDHTSQVYVDAMDKIGRFTGAEDPVVAHEQVGGTVNRFATELYDILELSSREA